MPSFSLVPASLLVHTCACVVSMCMCRYGRHLLSQFDLLANVCFSLEPGTQPGASAASSLDVPGVGGVFVALPPSTGIPGYHTWLYVGCGILGV